MHYAVCGRASCTSSQRLRTSSVLYGRAGACLRPLICIMRAGMHAHVHCRRLSQSLTVLQATGRQAECYCVFSLWDTTQHILRSLSLPSSGARDGLDCWSMTICKAAYCKEAEQKSCLQIRATSSAKHVLPQSFSITIHGHNCSALSNCINLALCCITAVSDVPACCPLSLLLP